MRFRALQNSCRSKFFAVTRECGRVRWRCCAGLSLVAVCLFAACAPIPPSEPPTAPSPITQVVPPPAPPATPPGFTQVGLASWYGRAHAGHRTASGEPFNPNAMTAAHRTLPLGAMVRVTNVGNGRTITVRINDRGPTDGSRIIDLSRAAAEALGFRANGIARVRLERL